MSKKIYVTGKATLATLDDSDKVLVTLGATNPAFDIRENTLHEIEFSDLKTQLAAGLFLIEKIVAVETNIADFAVNYEDYTFQQGDIIVITDSGVSTLYMYVGGDKDDVANYLLVNVTAIDWSNLENIPQSVTDLITARTINDLSDPEILSIDAANRTLHNSAGTTVLDFSDILKTSTDIQQNKAVYFYKSDTEGDAVDDLRFSNIAGAFVIEKCTVLNATKGAGTWVVVSTGTLTQNTILVGDANNLPSELALTTNQTIGRLADNIQAIDISNVLEGNDVLVAGQCTITDVRITVDSIVFISESTTGYTTSVPTRYAKNAGQVVFTNTDGGNANGQFSYRITL